MPIPVSLTAISTCEFTRSSRTWMRPPRSVNFTAFEHKFHRICRRRSGSPETGARARIDHLVDRRPLASAAGRMVSSTSSMSGGSATAWTFSRSLPDTMRETSSTSSTICVSDVALRATVSIARLAFSPVSRPDCIMRR